MSDVTIPTAQELADQLKLQVRNQIKQVQQLKASVPARVTQLQTVIAREDVIAAFGTEMADVQAAIAAL